MVLSDAPKEFVVVDVPVLGGTLGVAPIPGRTRHYGEDWRRLLAWAPSHVVTSCEQHELDRKGAGTLGLDCQAQGIAWDHFPILDFGVPSETAEKAWPGLSARLRQTLNAGSRVLVHCFGGCGRSGMIAARLMVEAGEEPEAALSRLRRLHPRAVETREQELWIAGGS